MDHHRSLILVAGLGLVLASIGGCAEDADDGAGSTPSTSWQMFCAAQTERDKKCDPANPPNDYEACAAKESTCKDLFHGPALEAAAACLVKECGSDDPCFRDATNAAPEYAAFKTACEGKFDGCPSIDNKKDDVCWGAAVAGSSLLGELDACLDKSCAEVMACFEAAFDTANACD